MVGRSVLLGALLCASSAVAMGACGESEPAAPVASEAGFDAPLFAESGPPDAEPEPGLGDPCGDRSGLEPSAPWPVRGGCPKRAGFAGRAGPRNAVMKWSLALDAGETSAAIDARRTIWVGTAEGDIVAISPGGVVQARAHTGGAIRSSAAIAASGAALVGSTDGALYGVVRAGAQSDAGSGADAAAEPDAEAGVPEAAVILQAALGPIASSPVVAPDGTIYVGTSDGKLVAVAPDGSPKWTATTNDIGGSSPAVGQGGTIYVGSSDHHLYAIAEGGAVRWSYDAGAPITGSPAVGGDDVVYVGTADGKLLALDPSGAPKWTYQAGAAISGTPAVYAGTVYVGSGDAKLHAVSTRTGAAKWTFATLGTVATPAVDRDGMVFVGSEDGRLYVLTPGGSLFFAVNVKSAIKSAPAISDDGTMYVTTAAALVAIGP